MPVPNFHKYQSVNITNGNNAYILSNPQHYIYICRNQLPTNCYWYSAQLQNYCYPSGWPAGSHTSTQVMTFLAIGEILDRYICPSSNIWLSVVLDYTLQVTHLWKWHNWFQCPQDLNTNLLTNYGIYPGIKCLHQKIHQYIHHRGPVLRQKWIVTSILLNGR